MRNVLHTKFAFLHEDPSPETPMSFNGLSQRLYGSKAAEIGFVAFGTLRALTRAQPMAQGGGLVL